MTTSLRRGATRTLLAVAVATAPLLLNTPAHATDTAPVTGTYKSAGSGYDSVIDGHSAGTDILTVNGQDVPVFCVQYHVAATQTGTFTAVTRQDSGVANLDKVAAIAVDHASIGTPLADERAENTAANLAIWGYSDALDYSGVPNADIVARAAALTAAAQTRTEDPIGYKLTATATAEGTTNTATATVLDTAGQPVAGQEVTFTFDDSTVTVPTGADGVATTTVAAPATPGTAVASINAVLPAGTVMAPEGGAQKVITTKEVDLGTVETSFQTLAATVTPEETVAPAAPADETPAVTDTAATLAATTTNEQAAPTQLPYTGGFGTVAAFVALAALTAGALVVRRHLKARTH